MALRSGYCSESDEWSRFAFNFFRYPRPSAPKPIARSVIVAGSGMVVGLCGEGIGIGPGGPGGPGGVPTGGGGGPGGPGGPGGFVTGEGGPGGPWGTAKAGSARVPSNANEATANLRARFIAHPPCAVNADKHCPLVRVHFRGHLHRHFHNLCKSLLFRKFHSGNHASKI